MHPVQNLLGTQPGFKNLVKSFLLTFGTHLKISVWHLLIKLKNNCLLKKLMTWTNRKCKNFNIYYVVFFQKNKKTPQGIIILHLCTKNLDNMIYSSWDIECDRLKLLIMGHSLLFYTTHTHTHTHTSLENPEKSEFWKNKNKFLEILSFYSCIPKIIIIWGSWAMECDRQNFLSFWAIFCPFTPIIIQKIKILEK